ncbi:MAG: glutamate transporter substrate-binding protein [Pseudonocardiales bacterium]|nr:glutamate transporter substrate-binding protein [Pseudonocardiales bacterium]
MTTTPANKVRFKLTGALAALGLLVSCSAGSTPTLPSGTASTVPSATPAPSATPLAGCNDSDQTRVKSYAPAGALPTPGSFPTGTMATIAGRKLIAAVSADNRLFGARNPLTNQLEGFDIDMVRTVARAIFGNLDDAAIDAHIEYRVVNFAQRIPALVSEQVDLVADIMTINCTRWSQIAFSAEYYRAAQQLLVANRSNLTLAKMNGKRVCSAEGSTGSENLQTHPSIKAVLVPDISDCMVLFQQGSVDGVVSDNTVVAGFASQDPYAEVVKEPLTQEPYGLGIQKGQTDFVQFVNAVLENMRTTGTWTKLYNKWLAAQLGAGTQPAPVYGR